jgi:heptose-I-phosphate ethanolaminephosphotransferase
VPFIVWHSSNGENGDELSDPKILNRQYDNADFIYTFSDLLGLSYDGYLEYESILSKNFIEDNILVGDPYAKGLSVLNGTIEFKTSHHAQRH